MNLSPDSPVPPDSLRQQVRARFAGQSFWVSVSEGLKTLITLGVSLLAARMISPEDFGLIGIVFLVFGILNTFSQAGVGQAVVQYRGDVLEILNEAWTWQALRGIGLMIICLVCAPLLTWFYEKPLTLLMMVCAWRLFFLGIKNNGVLFFERQLDFKKIFQINMVQVVARVSIEIPALLILQNVWALVIGTLMDAVILCVVSYRAHPFRPKLSFDREKFRYLMGYGKWLAGLTIILFIATQGDDIFVSKYFGPAMLGFYQMAYNLSNTPATKISHVFGRIGFPSYAKHQDDQAQMREIFVLIMRVSVFLSGMLSVLLGVGIPLIVRYVLSDTWQAIIPMVEVLVVSAFLRAFLALAGPLFRACGHPELDFRMNVGRFFIVALGLWPAAHFGGILGVCWLIVLALCSCLPGFFSGVKRLLGMSVWDILRHNTLSLLACGVFLLTLWSTGQLLGGVWWMDALGVAAGAGCWALVMWLLGRCAPGLDLFAALGAFRDSIKRLKSA